MVQQEQETQAVSRKLIELSMTRPPIHSFNRQLVRIVVDTVGAAAATLWLVREQELVRVEEIEQQVGAIRSIGLPEQAQQQALRRAFESGEVVTLADSQGGGTNAVDGLPEHNTVVFIPVVGLRGNLGVLRLVFGPVHPVVLSHQVQLAETLSGYYSLYSAQRILTAQHEERQHIDRLSKAVLQLQHYSFSRQLPEVIVNSAAEVARVDRAVLLTTKNETDLRLNAVSSVSEPDRKSAWSRLCTEFGELVLAGGEPVMYFPEEDDLEEIEDDELREKVNSYVTLTEANSLMVFPLQSQEEPVGVLILEAYGEQALTAFERIMCTVYASHAGSALINYRLFRDVPLSGLVASRLDQDTSTVKRGRRRAGKVMKILVIVGLLAAMAWFVGIHPVDDHVSADCFVEPASIRLVTAPYDGTIKEVPFLDAEKPLTTDEQMRVTAGTVLLRMDTTDLETALAGKRAELESLYVTIREYRDLATGPETESARVEQYKAEMRAREKQAEAKRKEMAVLQRRLDQAALRAPIGGLVTDPQNPAELKDVTVRQGEQLMRIGAFEDAARIRVAVPGEDIKSVEPGMQVRIQLRSFLTPREEGSSELLAGEVARVAPRSETYKNANVFMADVYVALPPPDATGPDAELRELLKPGMTGKARILREEKSTYLKIYAREIKNKIDYWLF